ncbi:MAG: hypothetical protein IT317_07595 [Anaerolineales bacterium]|nr:hypothetical protein [Anaerolineales bacterium]
MSLQVRRLAWAVAIGFLTLALTAGYWAYLRREPLLSRADNPRRVLAEVRVPRGPIYDRHDQPLATTLGEPGDWRRAYPYAPLAPVLGYVSPLYGRAGIEAAFDGVLHGDAGLEPFDYYWQATVLGQPPAGRGVRLTLDLTLQQEADAALGGLTGAVVALDAQTGEVLALASHPTFDANQLEGDWETLLADPNAPLLNRATLGLYQPGGALWPLVLAGAAESGQLDLGRSYRLETLSLPMGDEALNCRVPPRLAALTLRESLLFGCPGPTGTVGAALGADKLQELFAAFGLSTAAPLALPTSVSTAQPVAAGQEAVAAAGQGALTLTPLQLALATSALVRDGMLPAPQLVLATQNPDGVWRPEAPPRQPQRAVSTEAAAQVRPLLAHGYASTAASGTEGRTLTWYQVFGPQADARVVVVVLLEGGSPDIAAGIGEDLLATALARP